MKSKIKSALKSTAIAIVFCAVMTTGIGAIAQTKPASGASQVKPSKSKPGQKPANVDSIKKETAKQGAKTPAKPVHDGAQFKPKDQKPVKKN
ncbi:hypothetical protein H9X96_13635 [Pedobacter sp. N36a]|uniref:hypothetical protein n=1 Tax=Pedobacter sp. N36a TaxID=2767996 RepID=UPI0016572B7A|nr:hypothetical protein [Pedobacter sp. N36a]MBC8986817.1 hypothetical protein [Pedobacter sp. N36a]